MFKFRDLGLYIPGWWNSLKKWWALWTLPRTQDFTNDFKEIQVLSVECRRNLCPWEVLAFSKCTFPIPEPSHHPNVPTAEDFSVLLEGANFRQQIILRKMKLGISRSYKLRHSRHEFKKRMGFGGQKLPNRGQEMPMETEQTKLQVNWVLNL